MARKKRMPNQHRAKASYAEYVYDGEITPEAELPAWMRDTSLLPKKPPTRCRVCHKYLAATPTHLEHFACQTENEPPSISNPPKPVYSVLDAAITSTVKADSANTASQAQSESARSESTKLASNS